MRTPAKTGNAGFDAAIADTVRDLPRVVSCGRVETDTIVFTVRHKLGVKPDFYLWNSWTDIRVFASDELQAQWTRDLIVLCASAQGTINLFVGKL